MSLTYNQRLQSIVNAKINAGTATEQDIVMMNCILAQETSETIQHLITADISDYATSTKVVDVTAGLWAITGALTVSSTIAGGTTTITSSSANALTVGRQGATAPVLKVNAATASVATGVEITGAAEGAGVNIAAISSGTNEALTINAKGTGTITIGNNSTGAITLTRAVTCSSGLDVTGGITATTSIAATTSVSAGTSISATTVFLGGNGAANAVTYGFTSGSSTSGMFLSAANAIGFSTDSTERWVINASGSLNPATDNTYDIGNGSVNPRDITASRYVTVKQALALTPVDPLGFPNNTIFVDSTNANTLSFKDNAGVKYTVDLTAA